MPRRDAMIEIRADGLDAMIAYLREIQRNGPGRVHRALDGALERTAEISAGLAHVSADPRHRGTLKASGETSSVADGTTWTGSLIYGEKTGAAWEMRRGGEHEQFVSALPHLMSDAFADALAAYFADPAD